MFQKGDYVIYENTGICQVQNIETPKNLPAGKREKLFYKLSPLHDVGTIYIAVDSTAFMRPVISKYQAMDLISKIPYIQNDTYQNQDQRLMAKHYKESIETHDCKNLVQIIKTVYNKNRTMLEHGKKPNKTDLQFKKRAETLLHGELAVALDIPFEDVESLIQQHLKNHI